MPAVTVEVKLNGLPTANTHSPTFSFSESPNGMVGRSFASILSKAISVVGSVPTNLAANLRLSFNVTSSSSAPSITWLFVIIYPSVEMITPEPAPTRGCGCGRWNPPRPPNPKKYSNGSTYCGWLPPSAYCLAFVVALICTTPWTVLSAAVVKSVFSAATVL